MAREKRRAATPSESDVLFSCFVAEGHKRVIVLAVWAVLAVLVVLVVLVVFAAGTNTSLTASPS